jgi:Zn-dependent peptidase ImmA (M78 family)
MADLSPSRAAIQLLKAWSIGKTDDDLFPINCKEIAEGLGISVVGEELNNDFQGCLFLTEGVKAIIYNNSIASSGRINYTIGHELGHYCLHKNRGDLHCSLEDLNNIGSSLPHSQDIEKEANQFAANLLMPASDLRTMIKNQVPCIQLAEQLSIRYETSLLATIYRVVQLTQHVLLYWTTKSVLKALIETINLKVIFSQLAINFHLKL